MTTIIETSEVFEAIAPPNDERTFQHIILLKKTGRMVVKMRSGIFIEIDPVEDVWDDIVKNYFC